MPGWTKPGYIYKEPCDAKCPAAALVYVQHGTLELGLCGHCFDDNMMFLFAQGFAVRVDLRPALRDEESRRR